MIRRPTKGQLAIVFDDLLDRIMSKREDAMDFSVDRRGVVMARPVGEMEPMQLPNWKYRETVAYPTFWRSRGWRQLWPSQ